MKTPTDCILRGFPGTYSRTSAEATWRRTLIDPYGQKWTPFATVRADIAALSVKGETGVSNYLPTGDSTVGRVMPAVGLEYRYPFISVHSWGTQTIEPIAVEADQPRPAAHGLPLIEPLSVLLYSLTAWSTVKLSTKSPLIEGARNSLRSSSLP